MSAPASPPSMGRRLGRLLLGLALAWIALVGVVLWAVLDHEVNELLDQGLSATGSALVRVLADHPDAHDAADAAAAALRPARSEHAPLVWQVIDEHLRVHLRAPEAPSEPLAAAPAAGFLPGNATWRVYGGQLPGGRWLLVGQRRSERLEAELEVAGGTLGVALVAGLAGLAWLRRRVRVELQPLADLRGVLEGYDPLSAAPRLPAPARAELVPVHEAVADLGRRLAAHAATERAFSAHAAHALRTPLAGIDAQCAVALREAPPALRPRLERMRGAATRLTQVVAALLALFRSGNELRRAPVDVSALLAKMSGFGLQMDVRGQGVASADADLLAAALFNLLDNAVRHGAHRVEVNVEADRVRLRDDGPGVASERLAALRRALDEEAAGRAQAPGLGLGLALADRVARVHGGRLELEDVPRGFGVTLRLGPGR